MATTQAQVLLNTTYPNGDVLQMFPKTYAKYNTIEYNDVAYLVQNELDTVQKLAEAVATDITSILTAINGVTADVELTQAEYDSLTASKYTNNVTYYITDGTGDAALAEAVVYDDTNTGFGVDNVQDAIESAAQNGVPMCTPSQYQEDPTYYDGLNTYFMIMPNT
jgi:alkaline phosphatase